MNIGDEVRTRIEGSPLLWMATVEAMSDTTLTVRIGCMQRGQQIHVVPRSGVLVVDDGRVRGGGR